MKRGKGSTRTGRPWLPCIRRVQWSGGWRACGRTTAHVSQKCVAHRGKTPKPLKRKKKPKRWTRIKPLNPERRKKRFERSYGGNVRVKWVRSLPCTIPHCRETPSVNAHVGGVTSDKGAGIKSSARYVVPFCVGHETEYHAIGAKSFAARYGLDLEVEAARVEQCWAQLQEDGLG